MGVWGFRKSMKIAGLVTIVFGFLGAVACGVPLFGLKPGFYPIGDPGLELLDHYRSKASVQIYLSGHAGISLGGKSDVTLEELRIAVRKVEGRDIASIMLAKSYIDKSLHLRVEELLLEEGFNAVLITGAHSSGTILERYRIKAELRGTGQAATRPESKSEDGANPQPEAEGRSQ
jgi:hypothetical protein